MAGGGAAFRARTRLCGRLRVTTAVPRARAVQQHARLIRRTHATSAAVAPPTREVVREKGAWLGMKLWRRARFQPTVPPSVPAIRFRPSPSHSRQRARTERGWWRGPRSAKESGQGPGPYGRTILPDHT